MFDSPTKSVNSVGWPTKLEYSPLSSSLSLSLSSSSFAIGSNGGKKGSDVVVGSGCEKKVVDEEEEEEGKEEEEVEDEEEEEGLGVCRRMVEAKEEEGMLL